MAHYSERTVGDDCDKRGESDITAYRFRDNEAQKEENATAAERIVFGGNDGRAHLGMGALKVRLLSVGSAKYSCVLRRRGLASRERQRGNG